MKIIPLGCGSAFTMKDFQTNLLIEHNGKRLLIDAGTDIRFSLKEQGLSYKDIDAVYITHLHADHIGGIEYLAFCSYFDPSKKGTIKLFGNQRVLDEAWNSTLRGGLRSVQGKVVSIHDYFAVDAIPDNSSFMWEGILFDIVQSVHIMDGFSIVPSYGLMIHNPDSPTKIYFTADSQFNPNQIKDFYKMADVIIQDCETTPYMSGVHAHYKELSTLDPSYKAKMWLIHRQDNILDNFDANNKSAIDSGFKGFCQKGIDILGE